MNGLLEKFLTYLRVKNYSPRSVDGRRDLLLRFMAFLSVEGIKDVRGIRKPHILKYQQSLYERVRRDGLPIQFATQNHAMCCVRLFFKFLIESGEVFEDPTSGVSLAKTGKKLPRAVPTQSEMRKILHAPNTRKVTEYRDKAMMELFYTSGIRAGELKRLKISDVNLEDGLVSIYGGKGNKDRVVPIGAICQKYLKHYINEVRPMLKPNPRDETLFLTLYGKPIVSRRMIPITIAKYVKRAGLKARIGAHSFRHAMATHMMQGKAPIRAIQEILGHESLESTQVYTHVTITDIKEAHRRCHPRNFEASKEVISKG